MEELNKEVLTEETMEIMEDMDLEVTQELIDDIRQRSAKTLAIGTVIVTGVIAGGYGLKKLWDKRKSKRTMSTMIVEETINNDDNLNEEESVE